MLGVEGAGEGDVGTRDGIWPWPGSEFFLAALLEVGCLSGKNPGLPQKSLHSTVASTEAGREEETLCVSSLGSTWKL